MKKKVSEPDSQRSSTTQGLSSTLPGEPILTAQSHRLPVDFVPEYSTIDEIICLICSHDGCAHSHSAEKRLRKLRAQGYLNFTESTLLTKHSRGEMPQSITSPHLEFDTCCLACLKFDGVVIGPQYDRDEHLAAVPVAKAALAAMKAARREKLSAAAKRRMANKKRK